MLRSIITIAGALTFGILSPLTNAQSHAQIINAGFEEGFENWAEDDPDSVVTVSSEASLGEKSAKIKGKSGILQQAVPLSADTTYVLSVDIRGAGLAGIKVGDQVFFDRHKKSKKWQTVDIAFESSDAEQGIIFLGYNGAEGRYDNLTLTVTSEPVETAVSVIPKSVGGFGLSPDLAPGQNFDLLGWTASIPIDLNGDGRADNQEERTLASGYSHPEYFYTGADGGLVMKAPTKAPTTSKNTKNVRSELRQMLRRGNKDINTRNSNGEPNLNNWVFSSAPQSAQDKAGAVDGTLRATLAMTRVTSDGKDNQIGVVVIGQIHAKDDEPLKLFYRKMPGHTNGAIYASHEPVGEDDIYYDLLGAAKDRDTDPANGIPLNQPFSYEIIAKGNFITVNILIDSAQVATTTIDQTGNGYDVTDEFMYFKAGVYNQNNTGTPDDYAQATFYAIETRHD
jgi:poly(beta-D-mannuronate) lyase